MKKFTISLLLAISLIMTSPIDSFADNVPGPPKKSTEELYHDLFLTFLGPHIDRAVADYYSKTLTEDPIVYPYQINVMKAERVSHYRSFHFLVTLEVTPVIGPHISVGKDRITFEITPTINPDQVKLTKFNHLETHELPPNWQHIVK